LDETMLRSNLTILQNAADQMSARAARLDSESAGSDKMTFSKDLAERSSDPAVALLMANEESLFVVRLKARQGLKAQLSERIAQLEQEVEGIKGQVKAKDTEVELITSELTGVRSLYDRNLVPYQRVTRLERDAAALAGERSALVAAAAQADGKITETQLQILQVDQDARSEAARDLRESQGKLQELLERQVAARDQLNRTELRAPQDGVIYQLAVHTVGGVINAGEPVMLIVPTQDRLAVQAKISPRDIDRVVIGQPATLRFTSFDQRTTPEVEAKVIRVSPDLTVDSRSGVGFYLADVAIPGGAPVKLVPGMPVEVFVETESRTVLSFLVKPLLDQVKRAFRDG
jgi:HlyD family secretion protein